MSNAQYKENAFIGLYTYSLGLLSEMKNKEWKHDNISVHTDLSTFHLPAAILQCYDFCMAFPHRITAF